MGESYPAHNVIELDSVRFSSNFDNGNLWRVERTERKPFEYRVWSAPDNAGEEAETKHCTWFYFTISGLPSGVTLKLNLMNGSKNAALYRYDMRPVYRCLSTNNNWIRIRTPVKYQKDDEGSPLYFEHVIDNHSNTTISFAFTYPYSYTTLQTELTDYLLHNSDRLNRLDDPDGIYYTQELLTHSCDQLRIDLLTITSCEGVSDQHEPLLPDLFPELITPSSRSLRPLLFPSKEIIFISARVHPGEVPAQHTLRGILDLLLDENDLRAKELRKRYVFKIIPMLNPDGVYRGHFRMDQHGKNLNRYYLSPDSLSQPSIYAVKLLLNYYSSSLSLYLDLHAHASKRGCFIYGNVLPSLSHQIQNQLYCKLISMNSPHFDYNSCLFSLSHMSRVDSGDQMTAEGSGRVSTYLQYGLIHSYTLECNYNMSKTQNEISALSCDSQGKYVTPPSPSSLSSEKYTPSIYAGVGRACVIALLDLRGHNPCSRISTSRFRSLERVRYAIMTEVKQREEYRGQVMKKRGKQMEEECFNWCPRVDSLSLSSLPSEREKEREGTSAGADEEQQSNSPWFITSKTKKKSTETSRREGKTSSQPQQERERARERERESQSSSPSPSLSSSLKTTNNSSETHQNLFPIIPSVSNDYEQTSIEGGGERGERAGERDLISLKKGMMSVSIPKGSKVRPPTLRQSHRERTETNSSNSTRTRSESPAVESSLILTGRSVNSETSSVPSQPPPPLIQPKQTTEYHSIRFEMKARLSRYSESQSDHPQTTDQRDDHSAPVPVQGHKQREGQGQGHSLTHSPRQNETVLDICEDYLPKSLQLKDRSPRRPQSSKMTVPSSFYPNRSTSI